jgi:hypothetical protein
MPKQVMHLDADVARASAIRPFKPLGRDCEPSTPSLDRAGRTQLPVPRAIPDEELGRS